MPVFLVIVLEHNLMQVVTDEKLKSVIVFKNNVTREIFPIVTMWSGFSRVKLLSNVAALSLN